MVATIGFDDLSAILDLLTTAARDAGEIALGFYRQGDQTTANVQYKQGGSPVTDADFAVDRFLADRLRTALPEAGWLSEETADSADRLDRRHVLVIDPIDGTRAFVGGLRTWAVSIALTTGDRPVAGVVYAPATGELYRATAGGGAFCNDVPLAVSSTPALAGATLAGPELYVKPLVERGHLRFIEKVPSLACRFVRVAQGRYDIGIASSNAHDWDLAAADLILEEAGGLLTDQHGTKLAYNRPVPRHPPLFAASSALHPALLTLAAGQKRS